MGVGPEVCEVGDVRSLGVHVELLGLDGIGKHGILDGEIGDAVADGINIVVLGILGGDVIENEVAGAAEVDARFCVGVATAFAGANVLDDVVALAVEGELAALKGDALARGGLAEDGQVGLGADCRQQIDLAADGKDDDAIRSADGITEGAGARVVAIGDNVDASRPAAGRLGAESLSAEERFRASKNGDRRNDAE